MGEIVFYPGVFRAELEPETPVCQVLSHAMAMNLLDVVYVGRSLKGEIIVGGSHPDADAAIGLLARGVNSLAAAQQAHIDDCEEPTA